MFLYCRGLLDVVNDSSFNYLNSLSYKSEDGLKIRKIKTEYERNLYKATVTDSENVRGFTSYDREYSDEEVNNILRENEKESIEGRYVILNEEGVVLCFLSLHKSDLGFKIGYIVTLFDQDNKYATKSVELTVKALRKLRKEEVEAGRDFNYPYLLAIVKENNFASMRVLMKNGFKEYKRNGKEVLSSSDLNEGGVKIFCLLLAEDKIEDLKED